ncbi:MAG: phosphohydrolase, partial [Nitrospirota bacterium]
MFRSIRFKLVLISLLLVSLVTVSTLFIVMGIMDRIILDQVMKRGIAVANSASTSAAYSILSDDRLALDNLTIRTKDMWEDILNVTAVDNNGIIVAHNDLTRIGTIYEKNDGVVVRRIDGATVQRVTSEDKEKYEISMPIRFSSKFLGSIHIDMSTGSID